MVTIETPRLVLRPPDASDVVPFMDIHEDPAVAGNVVIVGKTGNVPAAWQYVATLVGHWHLRGFGQWAVVEKATGELIGRVGPWYPEGWPGIELGWIIRHSRWNNGFATEASQRALQWVWENVETDHIISRIEPDNPASIRVAEKIGERLEGEGVLNGENVHVYGIRRSGQTTNVEG
jgi:RimJ/RimL family protein N-acetyltransferase